MTASIIWKTSFAGTPHSLIKLVKWTEHGEWKEQRIRLRFASQSDTYSEQCFSFPNLFL